MFCFMTVLMCDEVLTFGMTAPHLTAPQEQSASQKTLEVIRAVISLFQQAGRTQHPSVVASQGGMWVFCLVASLSDVHYVLCIILYTRYSLWFPFLLAFSSSVRDVWWYENIYGLGTKRDIIVSFQAQGKQPKCIRLIGWKIKSLSYAGPLVLGENPRLAGVLRGFSCSHGVPSARAGVIISMLDIILRHVACVRFPLDVATLGFIRL